VSKKLLPRPKVAGATVGQSHGSQESGTLRRCGHGAERFETAGTERSAVQRCCSVREGRGAM